MRLAVAATAALFVAATAALSIAAPAAAGDNYAAEHAAVVLSPARTRFILRCGGCHGTLGQSPPRAVPQLRGVAGWFLCTPQGRDYVIRLPNVARAQLTDAELAGVMNFVAFELGERSAPPAALRFTAAEVGTIRARPLDTIPLNAYRRRVVDTVIRRCGAPASLRDYDATRTADSGSAR